jgi:transposase
MAKRSLFWLSDDAWSALEPHLPRGKPGKPRVDDRRVISGILHVLKVGCRWRDVPSEYGPAKTIYNRYHRWSQRRIWQRIFEKMAASGPVPDELSIDSTTSRRIDRDSNVVRFMRINADDDFVHGCPFAGMARASTERTGLRRYETVRLL